MEYNKQPITLAEQIDILKQRGLVFENENEAFSVLNNISYFRLASYWRVIKGKGNRIVIQKLSLPLHLPIRKT
jgi:abortive infection bacteriophage resistance protein